MHPMLHVLGGRAICPWRWAGSAGLWEVAAAPTLSCCFAGVCCRSPYSARAGPWRQRKTQRRGSHPRSPWGLRGPLPQGSGLMSREASHLCS